MRPRLPPLNALKAFEAASIGQLIAEKLTTWIIQHAAVVCLCRSTPLRVAGKPKGFRKIDTEMVAGTLRRLRGFFIEPSKLLGQRNTEILLL